MHSHKGVIPLELSLPLQREESEDVRLSAPCGSEPVHQLVGRVLGWDRGQSGVQGLVDVLKRLHLLGLSLGSQQDSISQRQVGQLVQESEVVHESLAGVDGLDSGLHELLGRD